MSVILNKAHAALSRTLDEVFCNSCIAGSIAIKSCYMILNYVPQNHAVYIVSPSSPSLLNTLSPIVNLLVNLYSEMNVFTFKTLW
jgi:hypothetical protein